MEERKQDEVCLPESQITVVAVGPRKRNAVGSGESQKKGGGLEGTHERGSREELERLFILFKRLEVTKES